MSDLHLRVKTNEENTMNEIPILFNGEMVRAILEGRKTQTRRPIKFNASGRIKLHGKQWHPDGQNAVLGCPYGQPGDILWVRETWRAYQLTEEEGIQFRADGAFQPLPDEMEEGELLQYQNAENYDDDPPNHGPWRPSIHMPRWAARIFLRVKSVRIQRVQDISERDAWKEGCEKGDRADNGSYFPKLVPILNKQGEHVCDQGFEDAHEWFAWNWNRIYGEDNFDEVNPWVWAIEFERINPLNP